MDDEDDRPVAPILKQLVAQDLGDHSIEDLEARFAATRADEHPLAGLDGTQDFMGCAFALNVIIRPVGYNRHTGLLSGKTSRTPTGLLPFGIDVPSATN